MTNAIDELRRRVASSNPATIAEAEAAENEASAESRKAKAIARKMSEWDSQYGARKPMKVFEADVVSGDIEERTGIRQSGEEWSAQSLVFTLANVKCLEGASATTIEYRMPGAGKSTFSKHSEAAITVRESGGDLTDIVALIGRRWRFEGDWAPTFVKNGFWEGTYFYRVKALTATAAVAPDPANVAALAARLVNENTDIIPNAILAKMREEPAIKGDLPLQSLVTNGKFTAYAEAEGLLASAEGVFYDPTANSA